MPNTPETHELNIMPCLYDSSLDAICSCGWETSGYRDCDEATGGWEFHCDAVFAAACENTDG